MTKIRFLIIILCLILILSGCGPNTYVGEYQELDLCALLSLPGFSSNFSDEIFPLEEDLYGRILFAAKLVNDPFFDSDTNNVCYGIFIAQSANENVVCFYPNINYIVRWVNIDTDNYTEYEEEQFIEKFFAPDDISTLKERNDWNKSEFAEMICVYGSPEEQYLFDLSKKQKQTITKEINDNNYYYTIYRKNSEGQMIWFILTKEDRKAYLIALDKNGKLLNSQKSVHEVEELNYINNVNNSNDEVVEFMEINGFNEYGDFFLN